MKICLSARRFVPPFRGGVDVYAERLGKAFQRLGHQIFYLAYDLKDNPDTSPIEVIQDTIDGTKVWRFTLNSIRMHDETFHSGYNPIMGEYTYSILSDEKPELFIILNFYITTLSAIDAATKLNIPTVHIATDFVPICRRSTLIRWDGEPCSTGESLKDCSACFVSSRRSGRIASTILNALPEEFLIRQAIRNSEENPPRVVSLLSPYFRQVSIMQDRLTRLQSLHGKLDRVFAPTRYTVDAFVKSGFQSEKIELLPFAIDSKDPLSQTEKVPSDHTRFLFIGRIQPYKGLHILVEAFNQLEDPKGSRLDIYGFQDGYPDYFSGLMDQLEKNNRIHFHGSIEKERLSDAFSNSDYFILPSIWHENSPLILLDALQSGTPVIASATRGVMDLIQDNRNGYLFKMGDSSDLRRILQLAIDRSGRQPEMQTTTNLVDIDDYARRTLSVLEPV